MRIIKFKAMYPNGRTPEGEEITNYSVDFVGSNLEFIQLVSKLNLLADILDKLKVDKK